MKSNYQHVINQAKKNGGFLKPAIGGDNAPASFRDAAQARLEANLSKSPFSTTKPATSKESSTPIAGTKPKVKKAKW